MKSITLDTAQRVLIAIGDNPGINQTELEAIVGLGNTRLWQIVNQLEADKTIYTEFDGVSKKIYCANDDEYQALKKLKAAMNDKVQQC